MDEVNGIKECIFPVSEMIKKNTQDNIKEIYPINENRHYIITTKKGLKYHMLFKREYFMSFGKIFNKEGIGESVNRKYVAYALNNKIDAFIFVHTDGNIYMCPVRELYDYANGHGTIRETKSGETTYSIPVKLLRRWK